MRKRLIYGALVLAGVVALAVGSYALVSAQGAGTVHANLNGFQENPSIVTTGQGSFTASINDVAIEYELSYSGLEGGTASAAHIHVGGRDHNGGVSAFLCSGGGKPVCPATEGTVTGTIVATDVIGPASQGVEAGSFAELVQAIRAGHAYANVHTVPRWPGGEIRGQIRNNSQRESDR